MSSELHILYQQISDITKPLCLIGQGCGKLSSKPYHCCEKQYCDAAAKFALDEYGIVLRSTGHEIPFMSSVGCIVPLHLRPICTIHACAFSYAKTSDINNPYWKLRQQIINAEVAAGRRI